MKKIISLLAAFTIIMTVSCSSKDNSSQENYQVKESVQLYLKEADITMAEDFKSIISLDKSGEQILVFGESINGRYMGYITDKTFTDYRRFEFIPKENETVKSACIGKYGKTAVISVLDGEMILYIFNADGKLYKEYSLDSLNHSTESGIIIKSNGEDFIISVNNEKLFAVSSDGTVQGEIECKSSFIIGFSKNSEDIPTVILFNYDGDTVTAQINGTELSEPEKCSNLSSSAFAVCAGSGEYSLIANFSDGLYGLNGNEWHKLTDFMDNTFSAAELHELLAIDKNTFVAMKRNSNGYSLIMLSEGDISEIKSKKLLTLATFGNADTLLGDEIKAFNNTNENYRIEIKKYSDNYSESAKAMREDILSGSPPDILQNKHGEFSPESFGTRETLFVDMYELIDSDSTLNRDDFVEGYLEAMDFRGKLLEFSPGFNINTMAVKDKYLNGLTEWSFNEMVDVISNRPEDMGIIPFVWGATRAEYLNYLTDLISFIDFEKAECYYDSPEFINIIKLVQENELGMTVADSESFRHELWGKDVDVQNVLYINDLYLIRDSNLFSITSADSIQSVVKAEFNEAVTFVGYPNDMGAGTTFSPDNNRCFSIMKSCHYPEGAWEFIRDSYLTEDYYNSWEGQSCFPVIDIIFTEKFEDEKEVSMIENPETGERYNSDFYIVNTIDDAIYFDPFTDEEVQKYSDFVREAAKHRKRYDSTVTGIILEELTAYFEGERSAEEAADIIQSRVSIYISENYG